MTKHIYDGICELAHLKAAGSPMFGPHMLTRMAVFKSLRRHAVKAGRPWF